MLTYTTDDEKFEIRKYGGKHELPLLLMLNNFYHVWNISKCFK